MWNRNFKDLERILRGRIPDKYVDRLVEKGLSVKDLMTISEMELAEELSIDRGVAREILAEISSLLIEPITADQLLKKERSILKTGIKELDNLLGGGLRSGTITGIYGPPGSGKTQLSLHLTARALLSEKEGGLSSKEAVILDTEGTFDSERMLTFLTRNGLTESDLSRIRIFSAPSPHQLKAALRLVLSFIRDGMVRFTCIDSISYPFRGYKGLKELPERQGELQETLSLVRRMAEHGAVVLLTIHATKWGRQITSKGGFMLGHVPHNMLYLRKVRRNLVIVTLEDSSYLPPGQAAFRITESGLESG